MREARPRRQVVALPPHGGEGILGFPAGEAVGWARGWFLAHLPAPQAHPPPPPSHQQGGGDDVS